MPLKGFKGFNRRKSVGNTLEESVSETPVVSSFRVLERPHESSRSFDGGHHLARAAADARPGTADRLNAGADQRPQVNRGSSGTQNSVSSSGPYNSSSSAHHSSTSTLPSAGSEPVHDHSIGTPKGKSALPHTITAPPSFLRTAFAGRKSVPQPLPAAEIHLPQQHVDYVDIPDIHAQPRPRAMTDTSHTSESTATPSGALSPEVRYDANEESSNMFAGFSANGNSPSVVLQSPSSMSPLEGDFFRPKLQGAQRPPAVRASASQPAPSALFSPYSQNLRGRPLGGNPKSEVTGLRRRASPGPAESLGPLRATPSPDSSSASHSRNASGPRERSLIPSGQNTSPPDHVSPNDPLVSFADEDMQLAMQYMNQIDSPILQAPPVPVTDPLPNDSTPDIEPETVTSSQFPSANDIQSPDRTEAGSIMTTPKHVEGSPESISAPMEGRANDQSSMQNIALYADQLEEERYQPPQPRAKPVSTGKVMTPAQFERYKNEQERRQLIEGSDSESEKDESDREDEDDEEERNREMARQRRKQEADLAVYRQKMMKITGETAASQRPGVKSVASLTAQIPSISFGEGVSGTPSEEEEDEDVPLGILAAHGFPGKNRPPSHLEGGRASVQYKSETYPAPALAPKVMPANDFSSKTMPTFAKNLPKDPFFGASLVTPSDRQSLAFGSGGGSVHGGSQAGSVPGGPTLPGGLVGVIAKEERARAMRRGSPNAGFAETNAASGLLSPTGAMPSPPFALAEQQTQMQMTQQMTQMLQIQMQWMQQMMSMQQNMGGLPPQMSPMPQMLGMPSAPMMSQVPYGQRPESINPSASMPFLPNRGSNRPSAPTAAPSSLALSAHGPSSRGPRAGYAPSLAPSERSTVGQPSRYRPVSTMPEGPSKTHLQTDAPLADTRRGKGSGGTSPLQSPGSTLGGVSGHVGLPPALKSGMMPNASRAPSRPASRTPLGKHVSDDEDEDAGWAAMQAARDKKRGTWKSGSRSASRLGGASSRDDDAGEEDLAVLAGAIHYADN